MPLVLQVAVNDVGWDMQTLRTLNLTLQQHADDRPALRQKEVSCAKGPSPASFNGFPSFYIWHVI